MDPLPLAQYIYNKNSNKILHDGRSFLLFDEKSKLWRESSFLSELFYDNSIPLEHKHRIKRFNYRQSVLKQLVTMCCNESKLQLLDMQHHLLPIGNGLVFDVLEGTIRDRVEEDYFTFDTNLRYLDDDDLSDAEIYFRSMVSTETEYQNMLRVFGELLFGQTFSTKGVIIAGGQRSGKSTLCFILGDLIDANCIRNLYDRIDQYTNHYIMDKRIACKDLSEFKPTYLMQFTGGDSFFERTVKPIKFRTVTQIDIKNIDKYDPNKFDIIKLTRVFEPNKDNHSYIKYIEENCRDQIFTLIVNAAIGKTNDETFEIEI